LAADFEGILDLIEEMENYIKEKENGKDWTYQGIGGIT
jgi:hypothetical protein